MEGIPGFDGSYDLDLDNAPWTARELHWIKKITGLRLGEFEEALEALDYDVVVSFALVALVRSGKVSRQDWQRMSDFLLDAEIGKITIEPILEEGDDSPPPSRTQENETVSSNGSDGNQMSSSDSSSSTGEVSPETTPVFSGAGS